MACCGGKKPGTTISPVRYVVGSVLLFGYHAVAQVALGTASLVDRRFRPVAAFHGGYMRDLWQAVRRRDGIRLAGEEPDERCTRGS